MKQTTAIYNSHLVLEEGILWDGVILIEDDIIVKFGRAREVAIPENALRIDAGGAYVGPGFVDVHVHGGGGYTTSFQTREAAEYFLRRGTTSLLATPSYSLNFEKFLDAIRSVKVAMPEAPNVKGLYLEGPYTNPNYGANKHLNPWRGPILPEQYKVLVDEAGSLAKVWAIAPERDNLMPFLEYARKVKPNVKFAVAHSEATPAQIRALGQYRPTLHTHITNATGRLPVPAGTRGVGPDEYCFMEPDIYAEMISDSCGIHVCPDMQKLVLQMKGFHRTILITDSTSLNNPNPPELAHVTDLNFDETGALAGSRLTMDQACRNVMASTGCGIAEAFRMASTNPARALEMEDVGSIEVGKKADLVFVDDRFNVEKVMLGGNLCDF